MPVYVPILRLSSWYPARGRGTQARMRGIFATIGTFLIGTAGWALGQCVGIGTAMILSAIGSGVGLYWGRRLFDEWLG